MPHVTQHLGEDAQIKLHKCPTESMYPKWTKLLSREDFIVTKHTRICSNHFEYGQPRELSKHPCLYLKGYPSLIDDSTQARRPIRKRLDSQNNSECAPAIAADNCVDLEYDNSEIEHTPLSKDDEIVYLRAELEKREQELACANARVEELEQGKRFGIHSIQHSDHLVKVHTGLPSYSLFYWIFNEVKEPARNMKYYKGDQSLNTKSYQEHNTQKPGPKRKLCLEDELLLTLMKLRLNLTLDFIASLFQVSPALVSTVISTWISLLALELKPLIHWPSPEQLTQYYPECFHQYGKVCAIIDCTEVQTERPSLDSTNAAMYSNYKERHTYKVLVACTPGGTVSFISDVVGGDMSDVELVRRCGLLDKFEKNDKVMADKGFSNRDDFLIGDVELITPEFRKKDLQFSQSKNITNAEVSNARIHVERVIGRLKDFKILQGSIPLVLSDLVDSIFTVCGCLVNLTGILVPLKPKTALDS
jgi:hypothetical protein